MGFGDGWGGRGEGVLEVVAVGVFVEGVELVVHDADESAHGVGVQGQGLAAVFGVGHFFHQLED